MTIPDPPLDTEGAIRLLRAEIEAEIHRGVAGICSMCRHLTWGWWDIDAHGLAAVVDRAGHPTDQVPLHPACIPALIEHWAMLIEPDPDGGDSDPAVGVRDHAQAAPSAPRTPTGAYARRRAG